MRNLCKMAKFLKIYKAQFTKKILVDVYRSDLSKTINALKWSVVISEKEGIKTKCAVQIEQLGARIEHVLVPIHFRLAENSDF